MANKKAIKEFFKPSWKKILIALIIFILFPFPVQYYSEGCFTQIARIGNECKTGLTISPAGLGIIIGIVESVTERVSAEDVIIKLPFFVAASYLLSCAINVIYDKLRKNKK
jgi:hypothetical protein